MWVPFSSQSAENSGVDEVVIVTTMSAPRTTSSAVVAGHYGSPEALRHFLAERVQFFTRAREHLDHLDRPYGADRFNLTARLPTGAEDAENAGLFARKPFRRQPAHGTGTHHPQIVCLDHRKLPAVVRHRRGEPGTGYLRDWTYRPCNPAPPRMAAHLAACAWSWRVTACADAGKSIAVPSPCARCAASTASRASGIVTICSTSPSLRNRLVDNIKPPGSQAVLRRRATHVPVTSTNTAPKARPQYSVPLAPSPRPVP